MLNSLQYAVYKGMSGKHGALQFNFQRPHYYNNKQKDFTGEEAFEKINGKRVMKAGWKEREGCVFLEAASTKGPNVYDWDNKVIIALSVDDMGKILETLVTGSECKILHDPGAKSETAGLVKKYLTVSSPKGVKEGCIFHLAMNAGNESKNHTVPVSGAEVLVLRSLLQSAIAKSLNW